jgi:hypothetical protein
VKPYAVEVSFTMIVMAESDAHAESIAQSDAYEAWGDSPAIDYMSQGEVASMAELCRHGWDGACLPYGGDGETRLSDILAVEPEPERDTRTIDMFGG